MNEMVTTGIFFFGHVERGEKLEQLREKKVQDLVIKTLLRKTERKDCAWTNKLRDVVNGTSDGEDWEDMMTAQQLTDSLIAYLGLTFIDWSYPGGGNQNREVRLRIAGIMVMMKFGTFHF